jgi:hypothetical protein
LEYYCKSLFETLCIDINVSAFHHQSGVSFICTNVLEEPNLRKHKALHPRRQRSWYPLRLATASPRVSPDNQNPVADVTARNTTALVFSGDISLELRTAVGEGGQPKERARVVQRKGARPISGAPSPYVFKYQC